MAQEKPREFSFKLAFIPLVMVGLFVLAAVTMARTSSTSYCLSCHEMQRYQEELKVSSHAVDKDNKPLECGQCHVPRGVGPRFVAVKTFQGLGDLVAHHFGHPEKLDRRELQAQAQRFMSDDNCLACHQDLYKDAKDKPISELGRLCHDAYLGKNGTTRHGCAGCHSNLAHLPEFDRRYEVNAKFAAKLAQAEEKN
jgi:nitrate/TMAO reductase-like tetraheme cytochrome c subunit